MSSQHSPVMAVLVDEGDHEFANQVANALGHTYADIVVGTPIDAARALHARDLSPNYIILDIGSRGHDVLPEIDGLAEYCEPTTRVVVLGTTNDVNFYRELRQRGIVEYFTHPAKIGEIRNALIHDRAGMKSAEGHVITFMSAASGDGASTVALNTAFCLAHEHKQPTVLVDMDYQFGMIAKNLDISTPFGIKELFEHPDRGIDATLVDRMLVEYGSNLKVIGAPNDLRVLPNVKPELVRDLITTLRQKFKYVIIDLPHVWSMWVAAALSNATQNVMVAQLWLRSVTHSSRLLGVWRDIGISDEAISIIINRSGAKFKEAVTVKDYERVCNHKIDYYLANDIKSVVSAENQGRTILEVGSSLLETQFKEFSAGLVKSNARGKQEEDNRSVPKIGISSLFSRKTS